MTVGYTVQLSGSSQRANSPDLRKTGIHPDYWYPLALCKRLKKGKAIGVRFAGDPIVLVRTENDTLFALEDRCAHRQIPLHVGAVKGEHIQCGYHGWMYDATGKCISVPYLSKDKSLPNGVRSYPCREAYGLIFVYPGDKANLESAIFPNIPTHANPRYKTRYLDRQVHCHYSFMHENLMDMNHQFLHRRLMGSIKTVLMDLRKGKGWIEADFTFARTTGKQHIGEKFILRRRSQPDEEVGRDLMTIRTEYPYQTLKFWRAGSEEPVLDLWNVYVPVDRKQRTNHTFGLMMFRKPSIPGLMNLLWPFIIWFTEAIFAEDRWIVELEQKAFDLQGADWNQEIFPLIQGLRKVLVQQGIPLSS
jgi:hypothetical protein